MRVLLLIFFLFNILVVEAQTTFERTYGGLYDEEVKCVITASDSTYVLCGYSCSFNGNTSKDAYVLKVDSVGTIVWAHTFGAAYDQFLFSVCETSDGGFLFGGYSDNTLGMSGHDYYVLKLDKNGNLMWSKSFGGMGADYICAVREMSDGSLILAGVSNSHGAGLYDAYAVKMTAAGSVLWAKYYGDSYNQSFNDIRELPNGHFIASGYTFGTMVIGGGHDSWVVEIDANGNLINTLSLGGSVDETAYGAIVLNSGDVIFAGHTSSGISGSNVDSHFFRTSSDLSAVKWQKRIRVSNESVRVNILSNTSSNGFVACLYSVNNIDAHLVKCDQNGNIIWSNNFGGSNSELITAVFESYDQGYILSGYTTSFGVSGKDIYLIKTDANGKVPLNNCTAPLQYTTTAINTQFPYKLSGAQYSSQISPVNNNPNAINVINTTQKNTCCVSPTDIPKIDPLASNLSVCSPNFATVVTKSLSNGTYYQWQVSRNNGLSWKDTLAPSVITGGKATLTPVSADGWYRIVIAKDLASLLTCNKKSDSAVVKIKPLPKNISVSVSPQKAFFCKGEPHTLVASATVAGGGVINYQWKYDGNGTASSINGKTTVGNHQYKVIASANGCSDSSAMVSVTVNAGDTAKIHPIGPFCSSDSPVNVSLEPNSTTGGIWSGTGITNAALGTFNPSSLNGSFKIKYTTNSSCNTSDSIMVSVSSEIDLEILPNQKTTFCQNDAIDTIAVNLLGGNFWTKSGLGITNNTYGYFDPSLSNAGVDTIFYSKSGSCGDTSKIAITVNAVDFVALNTLPALCLSSNPVQLNVVNGSAAGSWSSSCGTCISSSGVFNPSISGKGKFKITYTTNGVCSNFTSDSIAVGDLKSAQINVVPPLCVNQGVYQLTPLVAGGVFSGTGVSAGGAFNPKSTGVGKFWIKYAHTGACASSDSIQITVEASTQAKVVTNTNEGCTPLLVSFTDSSQLAIQEAKWSFGDGTSSTIKSGDASISHVFTKAGTYDVWLKVTFQNGCSDSTQSKIFVDNKPIADFYFDPKQASTDDPIINFYNQSRGASSYNWSFGLNGTIGSPSTSSKIDETVWFDPTIARIKAKAIEGRDSIPVTLIAYSDYCSDTITKLVFVKDIFTIFVPKAFTPNGDGLNDDFYPYGLNHVCKECTNYEFMIFDRWGEMIFYTTDPNMKWNGKRDNVKQDVQVDVYVWKVLYTNSYSGKKGEQIGTVTVVR